MILKKSWLIGPLLHKGNVIAWFQGAAEIGPRALGGRSILANPSGRDMLVRINNIKSREIWRPIAPSVLEENFDEVFEGVPSDYMNVAAQVRSDWIHRIPAVVHIDGSARPQSVKRNTNPIYWQMINKFYSISKLPVVANTSFNLAGEPIVHTPEQALSTFMRSDLDGLAIGSMFITKLEKKIIDT